MKGRKHALTWIITGLFLVLMVITLIGSLWGLGQDQATPLWFKAAFMGLTVLIIIPFMIMMVVAALQRKKEIDEEERRRWKRGRDRKIIKIKDRK